MEKKRYSAKSWLMLFSAIALEVAGTTCLKLSDGFANIPFAAAFVLLYVSCFVAFTLALKELPLGMSYGIWGGVGTVGVVVIGVAVWSDPFTPLMALGVASIIAGTDLVSRGTE